MPPSVERIAWALLVPTAALAPVVTLTIGALVLLARWASEGIAAMAARWRALLRPWPPALLLAVAALALLQGVRGQAWWDLLGFVAWAAWFVAVRPPAGGVAACRDGLLVGMAIAVAVQLAASVPQFAGLQGGEWGRAAGTTAHANVLAATMLLAAATLALAGRGARGWRRWLARIAVVVALGIVLASGSRAVVVGAALGAAVWALAVLVRRRGVAARADAESTGGRGRGAAAGQHCCPVRLALLVLLLTVAAPLVLATIRGMEPVSLLSSDLERAAVFSLVLDLAADRPVLGHGGTAWAELVALAEPSLPAGVFVHAHSLPGHLLVRGGAVGLTLALLLALGLLGAARRGLARALASPSIDGPLLLAAAAGLTLQSFVDLVVINPAVYLGAFVLALAVLLVDAPAAPCVAGAARRERRLPPAAQRTSEPPVASVPSRRPEPPARRDRPRS